MMESECNGSNQDHPPTEIFTVGHGSRSWDAFLKVLWSHGIQRVVDVRAYPASRRNPHFSRARLEVGLAERGIAYRWDGKALGGFREPRASSRNISIGSLGMRAYADHMHTEEFKLAANRLSQEALWARTVILCAEVDPARCHRWLLSDYLTAKGLTVRHIRSTGEPKVHIISPMARVEDGALIYDGPVPMLPAPAPNEA
ncbi:MAG: DUF488 domain-containing protein [Thermodesulfobacteriota bacterium]